VGRFWAGPEDCDLRRAARAGLDTFVTKSYALVVVNERRRAVDTGNIDFWGAIALGFFVGYVAMMFITRAVVTNAKASNLAAFLAVIISGTAVNFGIGKLGSGEDERFGEYFVGLAVGLIVYIVLYGIGNALSPEPAEGGAGGGSGGGGRLFPTTVPPLSTRRVGD
jgi:hypothetical protein